MIMNGTGTIQGALSIRVLGARALQSTEVFGDVDSYVKFEYAGKEYQTEVIRETNEPSYGEEFLLAEGLNTEALLWLFVMEKYDSKDAKDEEIGRALVPLFEVKHGGMGPTWIELEREGEAAGELCVSMQFRRADPLALGPCTTLLAPPPHTTHDDEGDEDVIDQTVAYLSGPRSRFLRYGYYYDLSKRVYRRAKRLPIISVTAPAYEYMMGGVLTVAMGRKAPHNNPVEVVDHFVACRLNALDDVIDATKDKALRAAVTLKNKVVHLSESVVHKDDETSASSGGRIAAIKGYIFWGASVAKPVVGSLPIVGNVLRKTMDYVTPTAEGETKAIKQQEEEAQTQDSDVQSN